MDNPKISLGKKGEDLASDFLRKKGYKIIERNFRQRDFEIDIVAIDNKDTEKALVFVEVKSRKSIRFGKPEESITFWKIKALKKAADYYKLIHPELPNLLRIDAVLITSDDRVTKIEHLENITGF